MSRIKTGVLTLLAILIGIQFVQPARNQSVQGSNSGIESVIDVPANIQAILQSSCYDCHSNNTRYPWYANIQPGAWWMVSHIKKGKAELNFDEFGNYSKRRQISKLRAIKGSVEDETMPLSSYIFFHNGARLSKLDRILLNEWMEKSGNEISK